MTLCPSLPLPEVGVEGQKRLKAERVLLVGAGGLGSPAGLYLAAAGVASGKGWCPENPPVHAYVQLHIRMIMWSTQLC